MKEIYTRRELLKDSAIAAIGATAIGAIFEGSAIAADGKKHDGDVSILQAALDLEHQGIWAYSAAAPKLSKSDVGKTVLALAVRNRADHVKHKETLEAAIKSLGSEPVKSKATYDLSSYIKAGEGNLDSDANIAKLALALEVDAALAYNDAFTKLKNAGLIAAAATIGPNEAAHAAAIRYVFHTLDGKIEAVPAAFVSADTRSQWILRV